MLVKKCSFFVFCSLILLLFRYDVLDHIPPGEELRMCLLVKTSLGRIRRWRQDQCQVQNF